MKGKNNARSDDSDDDASQASNQVNTDNSAKFIPVAKLGDKPRTKKIVINISDTQYPIVQEVAEELGWLTQKTEGIGDWDVWWTDRQIEPNTLFRMNLHQKINHFPGIYILARKNLFGLGLMSMKEHFPQEYSFFPETWTVPLQFSQFRHYFQSVEKGKIRTYIVKPEALSQGRGIFLTRNIEDIINGNKYVIQRYIKNPLLIDRLKFDLRIYVLLAGTDPLRLYIYHQGLTRFATEQYQQPTADNMSRSYIHLTNYSLNKNNPNYVFNTSDKDMDKGHKRTLSSTYQKLAKNGVDVQKLKLSIQDAIIKSVISGLPGIRHQYQYCQPEEYEGGMCFHILGFDVMMTDDFKPIVIEVNHTPSFQTGTPLDYLVKKNLIKDTLKLMRITQKNKRKNFERAKQIAKIRLQTGKRDIYKGREREEIIKRARVQRDLLEKDLMGGYKRIFPPEDPQAQNKYNKMYDVALKIYKEDSQTRKKIINEEKKIANKTTKEIKTSKDKTADKNGQIQNKTQKGFSGSKTAKCSNCKTKEVNIKQFNDDYQTLQNQGELGTTGQQLTTQSMKQYNMEQQMLRQSQAKCQVESVGQNEECDKLEALQKRTNFRMKVSKKSNSTLGSNQQLVKYTESIKKFNQLMVRFMITKDDIPDYLPHDMDQDTFQKLKHKLMLNRQSKSNSQNTNTPPPISYNFRQPRPLPTNPTIKAVTNLKDIKLEVRNGSFLRPKNYLISDERHSHQGKQKQREEQESLGREKQGILREAMIGEYLIGGVIVQNKSSKAYSKLLKNPATRNIILPYRR